MTRARDAASNAHAATYVHPTGAGNQHVPAAGAAGQLLQYASAGTAAWATISTGADDVVFPNFASPNNTYTSSGTWSKGSLSDDDYVWMYIVGGGGGGGRNNSGYPPTAYSYGGEGGHARLLYGKAKVFDAATYVIGAGGVGSNNPSSGNATANSSSSITLSSTYGSAVYTTTDDSSLLFVYIDAPLILQSGSNVTAVNTPSNTFAVPAAIPTWSGAYTGTFSTYNWSGGVGGKTTAGGNAVFGGGGGGGHHMSASPYQKSAGDSLYAGAGGASSSTSPVAGTVPGGGGGSGMATDMAGANGAAGNLRVYHV